MSVRSPVCLSAPLLGVLGSDWTENWHPKKMDLLGNMLLFSHGSVRVS